MSNECELCGGSGEVEITPAGKEKPDVFGCPACIQRDRDTLISELSDEKSENAEISSMLEVVRAQRDTWEREVDIRRAQLVDAKRDNDELKRVNALIGKELDAIKSALAEEREACARAAEDCAAQFDCDLPQPGDAAFRRGGMAAAAAIRMRSNSLTATVLDTVAIAIHYPECWDTTCYDSIESALQELAYWFRCSNPDCAHPAPADIETGSIRVRHGQTGEWIVIPRSDPRWYAAGQCANTYPGHQTYQGGKWVPVVPRPAASNVRHDDTGACTGLLSEEERHL